MARKRGAGEARRRAKDWLLTFGCAHLIARLGKGLLTEQEAAVDSRSLCASLAKSIGASVSAPRRDASIVDLSYCVLFDASDFAYAPRYAPGLGPRLHHIPIGGPAAARRLRSRLPRGVQLYVAACPHCATPVPFVAMPAGNDGPHGPPARRQSERRPAR
jgi:hypothetical protein